MSDLSARRALAPSATQLPVSWYFDQKIFEREKALLFDRGPGYVGHELMVPRLGDYHVPASRDAGQVLVRNGNGIELLSNVCRHRQALILQGRGSVENIVCPLHRWTYDLRGRLLGAPHFPDTPARDLERRPLQSWQGLLFDGPRDVARDLAGCEVTGDFDFTGYLLDKVHVFEFQQNWKTFIEVYLEDYHVIPFHPGLSNFVTCDELRWQMSEAYSVQTVGVMNRLEKPGTPVYAKWHEAVRRYQREAAGGAEPRHGAIWMLYYPNIMLEWYPHCLIVSTLIPRSPSLTTNVVEFYYPEDIVLFERDFVEAEQAAYMETAREDDDIAQLMDKGRRALLERGEDDGGPYQSPMEDGMVHFHEYIRRHLSAGAQAPAENPAGTGYSALP
ncbi:MAG: aromatic ring-hydroxylating dioxygenase subunit alpha [Burkholderiales bacterium]|nr:aromatic ring-hydroxylating dioxygenase subunit alpha [Burkholderiales bacterium]